MPFFKMIENVSRHFSKSKKIRVALLIDEFFGGAGTAYGGYGFLARKFIAKYIPDEDIEIDVLLGKRESGRERVCTSLPPTPPDVPFGIRRFLKLGCGFSGQAFDKRL